jgi:spermidine/putrescine transport system ATP-binding protein
MVATEIRSASLTGERVQGSAHTPPPDVELINVSKYFKDVVAVDGISMEIAKGEFVSLLGPSGCGKTTTLRMIAGLEKPTSGEIRIQGHPTADLPAYRRPTNMVFQDYALFPHMSVFDNTAYGLSVQRIDRETIKRKVTRLLELVQLSGYEGRYPHQLSGGQQQRVALARALARDPAVLLLDEPLGSLDLVLRHDMQVELKRLHKQVGITFIYVTHDQEEALAMSDRIAVMNEGHLIQMTDSKQLYEEPATKFVAGFVGENNVLPCKTVERNSDWAVLEIEDGRMLVPSGSAGTVGQSLYACIRADRVALGSSSEACQNRFEARIHEAVFRGTTVKWLVRLSSGRLMTISTSVGETSEQLSMGDTVQIGWNVADVRVLTE